MTGAKCAVCFAMNTRQPGAAVFVNINSRLATEGICDRHRVTESTIVEFISGMNSPRRQELERIYPGGLIYWTDNFEKATSKKPVPEYRV